MRPALPDPEIFGDRPTPDELREWRRARAITQAQLADILQVIPLTVQRWEIGDREVPAYLHLALRGIDEILRLHRAPPPMELRRRQRVRRGSA